MSKWYRTVAVIVLALQICLIEAVDPIVEIGLGKIQGTQMISQSGETINAFKGIRYAKAPVGQLRFANPEPVEPWSNTLQATTDGMACPQPIDAATHMSEDCLFLNVYSRDLAGSAPVLFYIHGGSNIAGSGHSLLSGPEYLLNHNVVLVSINYRLGALGFLSTRTNEVRGNFGFLDQVLALKWVQEHIAQFGGNPKSVTIFGMSAGSMAVSLHMASPLSKDLFHRAIAMSGSATSHFHVDNVHWTRKLAYELSCPMYNPKDVLECLRGVEWTKIIEVCSRWEPYGYVSLKWSYEVDGNFLLAHPSTVFQQKTFNKVPLMAGITKDEFDYEGKRHLENPGLHNDIGVNFDEYAPELFHYDGNANNAKGKHGIGSKLKGFYLNDSTTINTENADKFGNIFSDSIINHGVHRLVDLAHGEVPVYYYRTDYQSARIPDGVWHGQDLIYVLTAFYFPTIESTHPDMFMMNRMTQLFTSFAETGVPKTMDNIEWYPANATALNTLYNDKEPKMGDEPFADRYKLWDELFPLERSSALRLQFTGLALLIVTTIGQIVANRIF